ncbi:MAG: hypothetical protein N4A41_08100 [Crocinitomicaceae bacterium]|jgi:hypothetical protein|nr:hypothetical protein [Crocinitomicaceae bacterium]
MIGAALYLDIRWLKFLSNPLRNVSRDAQQSDWKKRMELSKQFNRNEQLLREAIRSIQKSIKEEAANSVLWIDDMELSYAELEVYLKKMINEDFNSEQRIYVHSHFLSESKRLELKMHLNEQFQVLSAINGRLQDEAILVKVKES